MSEQQGQSELKPVALIFFAALLLVTSFVSPFTIPLFYPGAEGIVISSATSLASGLTGAWLYYKFRKSE